MSCKYAISEGDLCNISEFIICLQLAHNEMWHLLCCNDWWKTYHIKNIFNHMNQVETQQYSIRALILDFHDYIYSHINL